MNYKLMLRTLGRTLQLEALCLLLPLVVCLIYREDPKPFLYTIGLVGLLGSLLVRLRARPDFFSREGFAVVGLIWAFSQLVRRPSLLVLWRIRLFCRLFL